MSFELRGELEGRKNGCSGDEDKTSGELIAQKKNIHNIEGYNIWGEGNHKGYPYIAPKKLKYVLYFPEEGNHKGFPYELYFSVFD